jgi:hypothetical protein
MHLHSHVRNRVGDGMTPVIRRGGAVPVEVGSAYVRENRHGQEIPSLAVAVGREGLRKQRESERQTSIWLGDIGSSGRGFTLNIEYQTSVSFFFFLTKGTLLDLTSHLELKDPLLYQMVTDVKVIIKSHLHPALLSNDRPTSLAATPLCVFCTLYLRRHFQYPTVSPSSSKIV